MHTETCNLTPIDLLMNADHTPKTGPVWHTLWVKIGRGNNCAWIGIFKPQLSVTTHVTLVTYNMSIYTSAWRSRHRCSGLGTFHWCRPCQDLVVNGLATCLRNYFAVAAVGTSLCVNVAARACVCHCLKRPAPVRPAAQPGPIVSYAVTSLLLTL